MSMSISTFINYAENEAIPDDMYIYVLVLLALTKFARKNRNINRKIQERKK
jgi:hypothetical protein